MQPRPFYFMVTFWGKKYRDQFYSLCVSSLLAPNNIPILKDRLGSKILIATTTEDWNELKDRPLIRLLGSYIELFPIFFGEPGTTPPQLHAAKGHRLACRKAYEDQAFAGWLTPDLIVSDGMISTAVSLVDQGKKMVLCPAIRYEMEHPLEVLSAAGYLRPDEPLCLSAELLSTIAAESLHPEILRYEFRSIDFGHDPIWTFWRVPNRNGLILYTVSWLLLLGDFASIPQYQDDCFAYSTNDGPFVHLNFGHLRNTEHLALLNDSYDGVFLSLTPRDQFDLYSSVVRVSNKFQHLLGLATLRRLADISGFHQSNDIDPLRRNLHAVPILIHGDQIDLTYKQYVAQTQAIMTAAINFRRSSDYGHLYSRLAAVRDPNFRLPRPLLFPLARLALGIMVLLEHCFRAANEVLAGRLSARHIFRRLLHLISFGLVPYPGSRPIVPPALSSQ